MDRYAENGVLQSKGKIQGHSSSVTPFLGHVNWHTRDLMNSITARIYSRHSPPPLRGNLLNRRNGDEAGVISSLPLVTTTASSLAGRAKAGEPGTMPSSTPPSSRTKTTRRSIVATRSRSRRTGSTDGRGANPPRLGPIRRGRLLLSFLLFLAATSSPS